MGTHELGRPIEVSVLGQLSTDKPEPTPDKRWYGRRHGRKLRPGRQVLVNVLLPKLRIAPPENTQMANDIGHALALLGDDFEMLTLGLALQRARFQFHQAAVSRHADDVERLVELVRHARCHLAEGGQLRRLNKLSLDLLAVGNVVGDGEIMRHFAVAIANDAGNLAAPKGGAVAAPQLKLAPGRAGFLCLGEYLFGILRR